MEAYWVVPDGRQTHSGSVIYPAKPVHDVMCPDPHKGIMASSAVSGGFERFMTLIDVGIMLFAARRWKVTVKPVSA